MPWHRASFFQHWDHQKLVLHSWLLLLHCCLPCQVPFALITSLEEFKR